MTNMKVNCQFYYPNSVGEKEKKNEYFILFGSIKQFNNFVLKTSLKTCQIQIKVQILTKKN